MSFSQQLALRSSAANKIHPTELVIAGTGGEKLVGRDGNFNAYDTQDAIQKLRTFVQASSQGNVMSRQEAEAVSNVRLTASDRAVLAKQNAQEVLAAYHSQDREWQTLGSDMANYLYETANRQGMMRRLFKRCEVLQGNIPRIPVDYKNVMGWVASSASTIEPQHVRNKYLMPPQITFQCFPTISEVEISEAPGDLLEAKLLEAQEATMAQEDRTAFRLIRRAAGASNPIITIQGGLTPSNLGLMRSQILAWNLPTQTLVFASDIWNDMTTGTSFGAFFDPVTQYEVVQTGVLGRVLGMEIVSDAYRVPTQKVLNRGDIFVFTSPDFLGGYTDRGPIVANEINASAVGMGYAGRGWHLWEIISMALVGGRGVSYARRVS